MIHMRSVTGLLLTLGLLLVVAQAASLRADKAEEPKSVQIEIMHPGNDGKYILKGEKEQKDVTVFVGQKVTWTNLAKSPHTATSKQKDLFKTKDLDKGDSDTIPFDEKLYKAAGGTDKDVEIPYGCRFHGSMKGNIILKPAPK